MVQKLFSESLINALETFQRNLSWICLKRYCMNIGFKHFQFDLFYRVFTKLQDAFYRF